MGISNCGEALLTIINDLLDLAKVDAGKMDLLIHPFFLFDCMDRSVDVLSTASRKKTISLGFKVDPGVPHVILGDIGRVSQVLINLTNNALKFSSSRSDVLVAISAKTVPLEADEELPTFAVIGSPCKYKLQFAVTDAGIGIRNGAGLFEPFTQEDNSNTRKFDGTGLGLAICRRLVSLMEGRVRFVYP